MALGAQRNSACQLILKEAGWLTPMGIALGVGYSVAAATLMQKLPFGAPAWCLPTSAAVPAVLTVSARLASDIPARRATKFDPRVALRYE